MKVYLVGGAVRDELLGLEPRERDWVVVGATEQEMRERGFRRLDTAFPVFLHPETGEEYALARRERKTGPGYKGFEIDAGPEVTLEEDLARRDLRINAIARDDQGCLIDPFEGCEDLQEGLLHHVTPAFVEDPVRLLRAARFAAQLGPWGFHIAHGTFGLMRQMALAGELLSLWPGRLRLELAKALATETPWRFFETLDACGALARLLPSLATGKGGHAEPERMPALRRLVTAGGGPAERFALVLYPLDEATRTALAPDRRARDLAAWLNRWPPERVATAAAEGLRDLIEGLRLAAEPGRAEALTRLWATLDPEGPAAERLRRALAAYQGVRARDLAAEGLAGPALGQALRDRRLAAIRGHCP